MDTGWILRYMNGALADELSAEKGFCDAEELRLRGGFPAMLLKDGEELVLKTAPTKKEVNDITLALLAHSAASYADDIKNGFFTVGGGIRVGLAGRVVAEGGSIRMIRDFTSLNIRFPRQLKGICEGISGFVSENGRLFSALIVSPPLMGKTTLLRDVIRAASAGECFCPEKISVIDERGEISGGGAFDLGPRADVLYACPKAAGMRLALRSLSPTVIATDEIGMSDDFLALADTANSGVKVLATAHATNAAELIKRPLFGELISSGFIERTIVLSGLLGRGTVESIKDGSGMELLSGPIRLIPEEAFRAL